MQTDTPNSIDITDVLKIAIYRGENADGYARIGVVGAERALVEITRLRKDLEAAQHLLRAVILRDEEYDYFSFFELDDLRDEILAVLGEAP